MAFVFGSQVKGSATSESDFDVAVYFKPEEKLLNGKRPSLIRVKMRYGKMSKS